MMASCIMALGTGRDPRHAMQVRQCQPSWGSVIRAIESAHLCGDDDLKGLGVAGSSGARRRRRLYYGRGRGASSGQRRCGLGVWENVPQLPVRRSQVPAVKHLRRSMPAIGQQQPN
jgi:hypothetical protein